MKILKTKISASIVEIDILIDLFVSNNIEYHIVDRDNYKLFVFDADIEFSNILKQKSFVDSLLSINKPYPLASREFKAEDTVISVGNQYVGSDKVCVIAGPCAVEGEDQLMQVAGELSQMGVKFFRGGAYKPRSSPYAFQGMKKEGLSLLSKVKDTYNMQIVTELVCIEDLPYVEKVADIIQIGTRNMQNYELLKAVGKSKKTILLKRGMSATIEDLLMSAEYIISSGNPNVILCERGIRTFERATRNTLDLNAVPMLKMLTHLPVIVDPSHGTGVRELVAPMSYAAIACGADGVSVEVHSDPDKALSDGPQSLKPEQFEELFSKLYSLKLICKVL